MGHTGLWCGIQPCLPFTYCVVTLCNPSPAVHAFGRLRLPLLAPLRLCISKQEIKSAGANNNRTSFAQFHVSPEQDDGYAGTLSTKRAWNNAGELGRTTNPLLPGKVGGGGLESGSACRT